MYVRVLGSSAGGGLPQWNCGCDNCTRVRSGDPAIAPRTQDSVAVSADGEQFVLVNASPDVLVQLARTPELFPRGRRHSPIAAVVLTNGDVDHVAGLLSLRERSPLVVYATEEVLAGLFERNAVMRTLQRFPGQLERVPLPLDRTLSIAGIEVTAFPARGRPPAHLVGATPSPGDNVGLELRGDRTVVYAPSIASFAEVVPRLRGVDVAMVDGTFWSSDELSSQGLGDARAEDMAHEPLREALPLLHVVDARRKVLVHVNNTNPVLVPGSPERRACEAVGVEVSYDGMVLA